MDNKDYEVQKELIKEAISEWLDKKFSMFGKWTMTGLISAAFVGAVYLSIYSHNWPSK